MCVGDTKSDVMKAIHDGACDYWIKPLSENLIQNMWQHVARKMWIENKYLQFTEKLEAEGERYDSKLPLIDQKIEVINSNAEEQGSVEKNNDKLESSTKKTRFKWSSELDKKFVSVVMELNADSMIPYQLFFFSL
jgi:two-component response regulator (ARR-B family)